MPRGCRYAGSNLQVNGQWGQSSLMCSHLRKRTGTSLYKQKVPPESKAFTFKRDVFQYDCYDSMNPVLLPEKQGTTILLQLHVSIQQSGELLLYRYPLFALILSAVHPFAAGWISDIPAASGSPQSFPSWKASAPLPVPAPG